MLIGPKGSPPVLVRVTAADAVEPTVTWPKSMAVVEIAMSVGTARAGAAKGNEMDITPMSAMDTLKASFK